MPCIYLKETVRPKPLKLRYARTWASTWLVTKLSEDT